MKNEDENSNSVDKSALIVRKLYIEMNNAEKFVTICFPNVFFYF